MKLTELDPKFLQMPITEDGHEVYKSTDDVKDADGVRFRCPKCQGHYIMCWQPHVPQTIEPVPGRWNFLGTGYADLELKNGSSSILIKGACNAHFWIRNGEIQFC